MSQCKEGNYNPRPGHSKVQDINFQERILARAREIPVNAHALLSQPGSEGFFTKAIDCTVATVTWCGKMGLLCPVSICADFSLPNMHTAYRASDRARIEHAEKSGHNCERRDHGTKLFYFKAPLHCASNWWIATIWTIWLKEERKPAGKKSRLMSLLAPRAV